MESYIFRTAVVTGAHKNPLGCKTGNTVNCKIHQHVVVLFAVTFCFNRNSKQKVNYKGLHE